MNRTRNQRKVDTSKLGFRWDQFLSEVGSNEVEFFFTEGHDNSRKTIFVDAIKKAQQSYAKEPGPLTQAKAVP